MTLYETVFIVPADLSPQKTEDYVEKIKSLIAQKGGEVTLVDKWGRRRLAYPIRRHREGFYTFMQFKAPPTLLAELNQFFRVSEEVIRQVVCKALKGKPASPTMSLPVAPPHGHGSPSQSYGTAGGARGAETPAAPHGAPHAAPAAPAGVAAAPAKSPETPKEPSNA